MSFWSTLALNVLAPLATNFLGNLFSGNSRQTQDIPQVQKASPLSYEQAMTRAGDMINPMYNQQLQTTLSNIDNQNLERGFYGQMPGDAFKMDRAATLEANRVGQIANMANQLMQQNQQYGLQQQNMDMQRQALDMQKQQVNPFSFQNMFNTALQAGNAYYNWTGQPIWQAFGGGPQEVNQEVGLANTPTWNQFKDRLQGANLAVGPSYDYGANTKKIDPSWISPTLKF